MAKNSRSLALRVWGSDGGNAWCWVTRETRDSRRVWAMICVRMFFLTKTAVEGVVDENHLPSLYTRFSKGASQLETPKSRVSTWDFQVGTREKLGMTQEVCFCFSRCYGYLGALRCGLYWLPDLAIDWHSKKVHFTLEVYILVNRPWNSTYRYDLFVCSLTVRKFGVSFGKWIARFTQGSFRPSLAGLILRDS